MTAKACWLCLLCCNLLGWSAHDGGAAAVPHVEGTAKTLGQDATEGMAVTAAWHGMSLPHLTLLFYFGRLVAVSKVFYFGHLVAVSKVSTTDATGY